MTVVQHLGRAAAILSLALLAVAPGAHAADSDAPRKPPPQWAMHGWQLSFDEAFGGGLSRWTAANPAGRWKTWFATGDRVLPANGERQYYGDLDDRGSCGRALGIDPFQVRDGVLAIIAKPADPAVKPCIGGADDTSGLITTEPSFAQTYGRFVARLKMPAGKGLWPAFWLLPADKSWPPEIDAVEFFGGANSRGEGGKTKYHYGAVGTAGDWFDTGVDLTTGFHEYGIEWTADTIVYTFDGREIARMATPAAAHKPMYLLINLAIGGTWPELPDASTHWPARLEVDWVRAYRRDPHGAQAVPPAAAPAPRPARPRS
jgi:beta-glucanase (GH16 family)